jgi:hypothetical protein
MTDGTTTRSAVESLADRAGRCAGRVQLTELGDHRKLGLKGPHCVAWLSSQAVEVPGDVYGVHVVEDGSLLARTGSDEIIIESPHPGPFIDNMEHRLSPPVPGVYRVEQQSTSLRLGGVGAPALWRQTCGVDIPAEPVNRILYTRVAGVSCGIIPEDLNGERAYRLWVDYSYAPALLQALLEIAESLDEPPFLQ